MKTLLTLSLLALTLTVGCKSTEEKPSVPNETPVVSVPEVVVDETPKEETGTTATVLVDANCKPQTWSSDWDKIIDSSLASKPSLLALKKQPGFFRAFIKALAKAESCLKLNERYVETGLGKDAVTGTQNTSEGLLQLSYQDSKYHGCAFDWSKDKSLASSDLKKTIFDPKANLECGMIILEKQVKKYGKLTTKSAPYYWSVLDESNKDKFAKFKKYLQAEGFSL